MSRHRVRDFGPNKILAIKLVRELSMLGLKDAKDVVEGHGEFEVTVDYATQVRCGEEAVRLGVHFDPPIAGIMTTSTAAAPGTPTPSRRKHDYENEDDYDF
jgi:hypothetical protein